MKLNENCCNDIYFLKQQMLWNVYTPVYISFFKVSHLEKFFLKMDLMLEILYILDTQKSFFKLYLILELLHKLDIQNHFH